MTRAWISIGSNLGDRLANCQRAIEQVARLQGVELQVVSRPYLTEPQDKKDQPEFVNLVAGLSCRLEPERLLGELLAIELKFGRRRKEKHGPRVVDLDLLFYGDMVLNRPGLQIPHPRLHQRRFVLVPLCELDPGLRHPALGKTVEQLCAELSADGQRVEPL